MPSAALGALLLAAGLLGGCVHADPTPAPAGPPTHRRTLLLQDGFLEITIEAPDTPTGPKPTVISFVEEFRRPLLEAGVVVVSYVVHWELLHDLKTTPHPPAPPADEAATPAADGAALPPGSKPVGKWLLASPSAKVIGQGYFALVEGNARTTVPQVLDALATDPDVDPAHLGIVGFSTNGFTALLAAAQNPRLRVVVAIAACGDFHRFLHESTLAMNGDPLDLDPAYDRWLREVELVEHPLRLAHAAVLMVNGRTDLPVPIRCAETTAHALRTAYAAVDASDRYRFVVLDGGHVMGERAERETLAWLHRWLIPAH